MEQTLMAHGNPGSAAHRKLAHGLELVYQINGPSRRLALARVGVWPSGTEASIVRTAFDVPANIKGERTQRPTYKDGKQSEYHVINFNWEEMGE
jgi:hypothetical protein